MGLVTGIVLAPLPCLLSLRERFVVLASFLAGPSSVLALLPSLLGFAPGAWLAGIFGYLVGTWVLFVRSMAGREKTAERVHNQECVLE